MWQILNELKQFDIEKIAVECDTPTYIYSAKLIAQHFTNYQGIDRVNYAVKANSNINILRQLAALGAGFDIVSVGELERVLVAGGEASLVVFSGVAKTDAEIQRALEVSIGCFNVESEAELKRIHEIALTMNKVAPVALRINPNVDAQTHPYISTGMRENKFGIAIELAADLYEWINQQPALQIKGVGCHIGSQITTLAPFLEAAASIVSLANELKQRGIAIECLELGGGLGIDMTEGANVPRPQDLVKALLAKTHGYRLHLQPGRSIVGNAAILLTRVVFTKEQNNRQFVIVDAGMNDYIRPALYQAQPLIKNLTDANQENPPLVDIVGPVCESGDFFRKQIPLKAKRDDLLVLSGVGAYGFSMASNYNSRPRPLELLIDNGQLKVIRKREEMNALWAEEVDG